MFKSLLRTIPNLSGNITLNCKLSWNVRTSNDSDSYDFDSYVRAASLEPLQNIIYSKNIDVNLAQGSWEFDVLKYYKYYNNYFYKSNFSFNKEDYQEYDALGENNGRNKDYEWGCKRIPYEKHGYQFQFYAPMYIDDYDDIPDYFELVLEFSQNSKKNIRIWLTKENKNNYLKNYIEKYVKKIDSHVVYALHESNQATLYGVNVVSGGFTTVKDDVISIIYNNQMTQNNFDLHLCSMFGRNKIIMKQIIPLSFSFNVEDFLTSVEKMSLFNNKIKIYGHYVKNSIELPMFDFSRDYKEYYPSTMLFDPINKDYRYYRSEVNVLDVDYPSLHEKSFDSYKYSNNMTTQYSRWKMELSDDEHPYVENMSFGFTYSSVVMGSDKYGQYPSLIYENEIDAHVDDENLLTNTIENFDDSYNYYYTRLQDNYLSSWYDITSGEDITSYDLDKFKDVKYGLCLLNGVLYDFNNMYDSYGELIQIDKFGVLLHPNLLLNDNENDSIISVKYLYSQKSLEQVQSNCYLYCSYVSYVDVSADVSSYNFLEEYSQLMKVDPDGEYVNMVSYIDNRYYRAEDIGYDGECVEAPRLIEDMVYSNVESVLDDYQDTILANTYNDSNIMTLSSINYKSIFKSTTKYNMFVNDKFVRCYDLSGSYDCPIYEFIPSGVENNISTSNYMKKVQNSYISYNDSINTSSIDSDYIYCDLMLLDDQLRNLELNLMSSYLSSPSQDTLDEYDEVTSVHEYVRSQEGIQAYNKLTNVKELKWCLKNENPIYNRIRSYDSEFVIHDTIDDIDITSTLDTNSRETNEYNMFSKAKDTVTRSDTGLVSVGYDYYDLFSSINVIIMTKSIWEVCLKHSLFPHLYKKCYGNDKDLSYPLMEYKLPYEEYDGISEDVDNLLVPLFYDINSISESYSKYLTLLGTSKMKFLSNKDGQSYMIYEAFDVLNMYDLGDVVNAGVRYSKFDLMNGTPTKYENSTTYHENHKLNVIDVDGVKYGFFYIDFKIDNTTNSFNIDQDLFTSVNGVTLDQSSICDMFRAVHPYLKKFVFDDFYNATKDIVIQPQIMRLKIQYRPYVIDNTDTKVSYLYNGVAYGIKEDDTHNKNLILNRYFSYMTPLITKTNVINNVWELKYKKINNTVNSNNIYDTGSFTTTEYNGVYLAYDYDQTSHDVSYSIVEDYEYKHFNDSNLYVLKDTMETSLGRYATYEELSDEDTGLETYDATLEQFKNCLKKYNKYSTYDENEILFLFRKYNVAYLSKPVKLNNISTEKLYSLVYKFTLK